MATKVPVIDTEACIACGNCEAVCPGVFRLNESLGHSEVINPTRGPGRPDPAGHRPVSGPVHQLAGGGGLRPETPP